MPSARIGSRSQFGLRAPTVQLGCSRARLHVSAWVTGLSRTPNMLCVTAQTRLLDGSLFLLSLGSSPFAESHSVPDIVPRVPRQNVAQWGCTVSVVLGGDYITCILEEKAGASRSEAGLQPGILTGNPG